jgi:LPXTG-motif cell wall-anchored protein
LRQANGIIAGMTGMRWRRFVAFNVLGAVLWVGVWTSLGYLAGANLTTIWNGIGRYQPYFYTAIGLLVVGLVIWHLRRRRRERGDREPPAPPVADRVTEDAA